MLSGGTNHDPRSRDNDPGGAAARHRRAGTGRPEAEPLGGGPEGQAQLKEHLGKLAMGGTFVAITTPELAKNFPDYQFVALRFRIYPVARQMPEGMKPSNVFAVPKQGKPEPLKDERALQAFFQKHA